MSIFWGMFAAPLLAHAALVAPLTAPTPAETLVIEDSQSSDEQNQAFAALEALAPADMADAAAGADAAINIGQLGANASNQSGGVTDVVVAGATGEISANSVANNAGFTTIFNNTGNGVVFQNTVNVNVFLTGAPGQ